MKFTNHAMLLLLSTFVTFCSSKKSLESQLLGKWTMEQVFDREQDVTEIHNPKKNRWIKFNRNGSFESGGDPYGYNDGNWDLNEETAVLFLDSNEDDDDSEWKISFEEETIIWTGIGTPRQEQFKLIHKKEK